MLPLTDRAVETTLWVEAVDNSVHRTVVHFLTALSQGAPRIGAPTCGKTQVCNYGGTRAQARVDLAGTPKLAYPEVRLYVGCTVVHLRAPPPPGTGPLDPRRAGEGAARELRSNFGAEPQSQRNVSHLERPLPREAFDEPSAVHDRTRSPPCLSGLSSRTTVAAHASTASVPACRPALAAPSFPRAARRAARS